MIPPDCWSDIVRHEQMTLLTRIDRLLPSLWLFGMSTRVVVD